jgi:hypothetical protein
MALPRRVSCFRIDIKMMHKHLSSMRISTGKVMEQTNCKYGRIKLCSVLP